MKDGGTAYPTTRRRRENYMDESGYARTREVTDLAGGMTLRDHFAGLAMQGMMTNNEAIMASATNEGLARGAYQIADAMLAEREKDTTA